jgi:lipopolysaccharide biosynthesis glycosyltransferase
MKTIFIGYDPRQPVSYHTLAHSIIKRASEPVAIAPLRIEAIAGLKREGLTPFTYSRFLVPYLMDFQGLALFLDADQIVLGDVAELFALADGKSAVQVAKNPVHQFEWASVMLFDCAHEGNRCLTPEYVNKTNQNLHKIGWLNANEVGDLPLEWNQLVGYDEPNPDAKLVHFTQGIPFWDECKGCEYSDEWWAEYDELVSARPWMELMGPSIHAQPVIRRLIAQNKEVNLLPGVN